MRHRHECAKYLWRELSLCTVFDKIRLLRIPAKLTGHSAGT
jgi:hypothetical protein